MAGKTNKNRKYDRNRTWCRAYRDRHQREMNRAVRYARRFLRLVRRGYPIHRDRDMFNAWQKLPRECRQHAIRSVPDHFAPILRGYL